MDMAERHTEVGLSKRKRRLQWSNVNVQKVVVTLTFLFVPLFLLILFTYLPFFKMVQFSFYDMKYIGERKFVGLENYIDVFTRDDCFNALKLSLSNSSASPAASFILSILSPSPFLYCVVSILLTPSTCMPCKSFSDFARNFSRSATAETSFS